MTNDLKNAAIKYAQRGLPVFPCGLDKRPLVSHGVKQATTDETQIHRWWTANPEASIGLPTGTPSGMWVLDVDEPGGSESLMALEKENEPLPDTLMQITGGGGVPVLLQVRR